MSDEESHLLPGLRKRIAQLAAERRHAER